MAKKKKLSEREARSSFNGAATMLNDEKGSAYLLDNQPRDYNSGLGCHEAETYRGSDRNETSYELF